MVRIVLFVAIALLYPFFGNAQPSGYDLGKGTFNWYFGNSVNNIRFSRTTSKAELKTGKVVPFTSGSSATVSDPKNGDLLFYTDGQRVFDATDRLMPGGTGLSASASGNQTVAVCPVPGQPGKYFVFTNTASGTSTGNVQITVVDMSLFGNGASPSPPLGEVDGGFKNVDVISGVSEAMTVVPHANGTDYWLITQTPDLINRPLYNSTLISATSYSSRSFLTTQGAFALPSRASHFSYNNKLGLLAVAFSNRQTDAIVLIFDAATGTFNFQNEFIFNSAVLSTNDQAIYDIEWSPRGDYLYYTVHGDGGAIPGNLFQWDRRNSTIALAQVIPATVTRSFGLQRAPDGFIYHLYQTGATTRVGRIEVPDTVASAAKYIPDVFGGIDWAARQFPSVLPEAGDLSISFSFYGTCQNNSTVFFPEVTPAADSLIWEFGSGEISKTWSPVFTFESGTPATAKLTAFLNKQRREVTIPISIQPFQLSLQAPSDTTACRSEFPPPRGIATEANRFRVIAEISGGSASVLWSNGQTGNILKPDSAGYYYAIATDGSGCSTYAGVTVKEYGTSDRRSNLWYFGEKAGIDFTTGQVLDNSAMTAPEGCAVIGDQNGKLIFYTDGDKVYNRDHVVIATGLGGSPNSTQSALIIQVPGDESLYYIFTTQANSFGSDYTVYYSLFDLKLNNGLGAVVRSKVPLFARSTERITAHSGWLITHEFGNNAFRSYRITGEGIGNPVISTIGSEHLYSDPASAEGYMKVGPRNNLVVPLKTAAGNFLEVFHFLDSLGTVTDYRKVDLAETSGQVYGIEFSGLKIFASITGSPSKIAEYYFDDQDQLVFVQKVTNSGKVGALQVAPDGLIYIAVEGSSSLGSIGPGDEDFDPSTFNFNYRPLAPGTKSLLGLPNYINQFGTGFFRPGIAYNGICKGTPTDFEGTPTDRIDQFTWSFGDGAGSTQQNVRHLFAQSGIYNVSMNLKNRCGLDTTIVEPVRIFDPPARPTLPGSAVLCTGNVTLDAGQNGLNYFWTTGADTRQIVAETEGSYGVLVVDPVSGCRNQAITIVVDNRPDFNLGSDITLCEDKLGRVLDAQNPGATIQWTLNGSNFSTSRRIQPDTKVPGVYVYGLKVTDPITTCFAEDQIVFNIKQAPVFDLTPTDIDNCSTPNGEIKINITAPANNTFGYFLTGGVNTNISEISKKPATDIIIAPLNSGSYSVVVGDEITGCSSSKSVGISVKNVTFTVANASSCAPVQLNVVATGITPPFKIRLTEASGAFEETVITGSVQPFYSSPAVGPGTYTAEIETGTAPSTCKLTENNIIVTASPDITGTITSSGCSQANVAFTPSNPASGAAFSWTGPGAILNPGAASTNVTPPAIGTFTYKVSVSAANFCPTEFTVPVTVESVTPQVTSTDPCQDQVSLVGLTAGPPASGFTYLWYQTSSNIPPGLSGFAGLGQRYDLTPADNGLPFRFVALSSVTGCTYESSPFIAQVIGEVDATLTSTPACQDNQLVTFEAESGMSGVSYQWFFNDLAIPGALDTIRRRPEGVYKVMVSKSVCSATAALQMVRGPLPEGKLTPTVVICNDPENTDPLTNRVTLIPGVFEAYEWKKNGLSLGITDPEFTADSEGIYEVLLTNSFQCVAADRTEVLNDCIPKIEAPTAFRPGSSIELNKDFLIYSLFITDQFRVFIYNRWGELVFQSADPDFKWNGGYDNDPSRPLPGGTYAWVVQYVSSFRPTQGILEKRGGVMLLR